MTFVLLEEDMRSRREIRIYWIGSWQSPGKSPSMPGPRRQSAGYFVKWWNDNQIINLSSVFFPKVILFLTKATKRILSGEWNSSVLFHQV